MGTFAVAEYYKQEFINITDAVIVAVAFLVISYLRSKLSLSISEQKLKKLFALTLMLLSIRMLFFRTISKTALLLITTENKQITDARDFSGR